MGLGVAQYPVLLPRTTVTLTNAGAPHATLVALIVRFITAVLLVGPSFALLFTLQGRRRLGAGEYGMLAETVPTQNTAQPPAPPRRQPPPAATAKIAPGRATRCADRPADQPRGVTGGAAPCRAESTEASWLRELISSLVKTLRRW